MVSDIVNLAPSAEECAPAVEEFIKNKIKNHKVVIFSKTYCSYSKLTKNLFHELDHIYHAVELDKLKGGFDILKSLKKLTGNDHQPHVFVKGQYLGGGVDLKDLHDIDKLRDLLDLPPPKEYEEDDIPDIPEGYTEFFKFWSMSGGK